MSIAAAQYQAFLEEVARRGAVHTFTDRGSYLVFRIADHDVVPFWSSATRLRRVVSAHPKYAQYEPSSVLLADFLLLLNRFESGRVHVGTNWAGKRLLGYDIGVTDLRAALNQRLGSAPGPRPHRSTLRSVH